MPAAVETQDWKTLIDQSPTPLHYTTNHTHHTWAKTYYTRPELYLQPKSVKEIELIVNTARQCKRKIITVGSGHSPSNITTPQTPARTWIVNLDKFSSVLGYSDDTLNGKGERELLITVQAGIRLYQLASALEERGWGIPNLGSIWEQSLAGAIATATHGSSLLHGLLSENVKRLTIILSDGKSYECSADKNPELFGAALVNLGALGIVTHITYAATVHYRISLQHEIMSLPRMLENWDKGLWTGDEYSGVWWFPYSNRTIVRRAKKVEFKEIVDQDTGKARREWAQEVTQPPYSWYGTWMGHHVYQIMLYVSRWFPRLTPYVERFVFKTQYGWDEGVIGTTIQDGEKALLMDCFFSQYVNEWAIPLHYGPEAISRLQAWFMGSPYEQHRIPVDNHGVFVHAPIEIRVTDSSYQHVSNTPSACRALLDTSCDDGPSLYLNATLYRPYHSQGDVEMRKKYYRAFEWLMRSFNGKPHWAKNFLVGQDCGEKEEKILEGGEVWDKMYGHNIRKWRNIRQKVDPEGVFKSEWLMRTVLWGEKEWDVETTEDPEPSSSTEDFEPSSSTVLVDEREGLDFVPLDNRIEE